MFPFFTPFLPLLGTVRAGTSLMPTPWPVNLSILHHAPFCQNGAKSGFEMCFDIGSRHLGCWGQNTYGIQNKEVYATLYLQATKLGMQDKWHG